MSRGRVAKLNLGSVLAGALVGGSLGAAAWTGAVASAATVRTQLAERSHATGPPLTVQNKYGIVPVRGAARGPSPHASVTPNTLPCEVTCTKIQMSYFDGPIMSSPEVEDVF